MPTFIKIGRQDYNKSGYTSKGYVISRLGRKVTAQWGRIIKKKGKYYWAGYNLAVKKTRLFPSIKEAERFKAERITRRNKERYKRLPSESRI